MHRCLIIRVISNTMNSRKETELIIVPGHGVCKAGRTSPQFAALDASWVGIYPGEAPFYLAHIIAGIELAMSNPASLLSFSGGQTRAAAGPRSEAESYRDIARDAAWWSDAAFENRMLLEEFARDSLENLLFSLALFRRETECWPDKITVVGWRFKADRYDLHRQALEWPSEKFVYLGVNDPAENALPEALAGEQHKLAAVREDLFLAGEEWKKQRERRNPFHRQHPYNSIDPKLDEIFSTNRDWV